MRTSERARNGGRVTHKSYAWKPEHRTLFIPLLISVNAFLLKDEMLPPSAFAVWLLWAVLEQQVPLTSGARDAVPGGAQRSRGRGAPTGRGTFPGGPMRCEWSAEEVGDAVKLRVTCEDPQARITGGTTDRRCEYTGKPRRCPGYLSDPRGFWKQVGRALRRLQGKACVDQRALVKAGMCKRAPRDAHFKLDARSSVSSAQSGGRAGPSAQPPAPRPTSARPAACTRRADHRETAEEYCSGSWASVCSFFLSMLQNDDC